MSFVCVTVHTLKQSVTYCIVVVHRDNDINIISAVQAASRLIQDYLGDFKIN